MKISLKFTEPGYIASPYWPEMYRIIEISKLSGINRIRSEKKQREALEEHLRGIGMSLADYEKLKLDSQRPFHTNGDGGIVIPGDKILSCLVSASDEAPSKLRIESIRTVMTASDFHTGKNKPDGSWERFAVVKTGSGKTLSNQRGFRTNQYIKNFTATGSITHDDKMVKPEAIVDLLKFAGRAKGIGASRKMGWGRFEVIQ